MSPKAFIISILAGLASALCVMASFNVGPGAFPVMLIAAFPIYVATLSQGTTVGVGSSICAILIAAIAMTPQVAVGMGLAFTIPASLIGHQANLAQTVENSTTGEMEWYPLSRLFFNLCIALSIGLIILGYLSGYNPEKLSPILSEAVQEALKANPPPRELSREETETLTRNVFAILPFFFAGVWLIVHVINAHLAAIVCRASSMMPRPKDDIAASLTLPKAAIFLMLASLLLSFMVSGILQFFALVVAGIFVMAVSMLGLANLHMRARKNPAGIALVIASYGAIFFLYPLIYLFSVSGVLRVFNQQTNQTNTPPKAG
jgi:MFS family permease